MSTVDRTVLDELVHAVRAHPGVDAVAAVVRHELRRPAVPAAPVPLPAGPALPAEPAWADEPAGATGAGWSSPAEAAGPELPPGGPATLVDALVAAAAEPPDKGTTYLRADGSEEFQSYADLLAEGRRVLHGLRGTGIATGGPVLLQFADNRQFVTAFWACVLGGYVPTPIAVPPRYDEDNAVTRTLRNVWELLDRPLLLTDAALLDSVRNMGARWGMDLQVDTPERLDTGIEAADLHAAGPDDPALHLLTSGSTGTPKCVRHHHRSILARTRATALAAGFGPDDVSLNWMPLDHVGGIVMYNVRDVVLRCRHVNAETEAFLADPLRWLDWADRFGATNTWAPNFAFALVDDARERATGRSWDLSRLRHICNAGEAVVARTAHRFLQLLRPYGLPADAMRPCWGMSETSSGVTYSTLSTVDDSVGTIRVDPRSLGGRVRRVPAGDPDGVTLTEVGRPIAGVRLRIVDAEDQVLREREVGRLQVAGGTMLAGYHRNPGATAAAFTADGWFRTGDLAFLDGSRLTVTGREKDVVIVRGANFLTYDIESTVEQVAGTTRSFVAASGYTPPGSGTEEVAVFFVPISDSPAEVAETVRAVRAMLSRELGLHAGAVVPLRRDEFPKTGSGKIQRSRLLADLTAGHFADRLTEDEPPPDQLFERVWLAAEPERTAPPPPGVWLLLADDPRLGAAASEAAARSGCTVAVGTAAAGTGPVTAVLHGREVGPSAGGEAEAVALSVTAALTALQPTPVPLLVLSTGAVLARPGDQVEPVRATLPGLVRTAVVEDSLPLVRLVDLPAADPGRWATAIMVELSAPERTAVVAHRGGQRLVPRLRAVEPAQEPRPPFVPGGGYLVTGGLGGIGRLVCEYLLAAYGARLLAVGRRPAGDRLADLAGLGDIDYQAVDVTDAAALRAVVAATERRWGRPLDGVLHLAGADLADHWQNPEDHTLVREGAAAFRAAYRAKVTGTLVLADLLADRPDTALVLFSSANGELGGRSFGAYAAASSFLSGMAEVWGRERPVSALSWSMWPGIGMNEGAATAAAESRGFRPITAEEGIAALAEALSLRHPHLVVGLDPRSVHVIRELVPDQLGAVEVVVAYTAGTDVEEAALRAGDAVAGCPLPVRFARLDRLPTDDADLLALVPPPGARHRHVEPVTELERTLVGIWADVLGQTRIGTEDSFFEIGGNSARAVQLVSRIGGVLGTRVPVRQLYAHPTVSELATAIAAGQGPGR